MDTRIFAPDTRQPHLLATKLGSRDVNLFYGKFQALRNISLDVPDRAVTAIIGPSGCGKSSYLRLFNRMNDLILDARVTGRVEVDGYDIYARDVDVVDVRRRVGMVFQRPNPFPMSIFENVA
ncbi:MAG: ATP-binding cassette domain-containing protein, partial [Dehalococcoidia bacterium]|nr:ATP-binding cassette domain-containing protein [Dehalococcoidia bacterium]